MERDAGPATGVEPIVAGDALPAAEPVADGAAPTAAAAEGVFDEPADWLVDEVGAFLGVGGSCAGVGWFGPLHAADMQTSVAITTAAKF